MKNFLANVLGGLLAAAISIMLWVGFLTLARDLWTFVQVAG